MADTSLVHAEVELAVKDFHERLKRISADHGLILRSNINLVVFTALAKWTSEIYRAWNKGGKW